MLHKWLETTDGTRSMVRLALLDYRKAFDLVDQYLLIGKLFSLGMKPSVVNWIADLLRGRFQRVKICSEFYSGFMPISAGIQKGIKIGRWLFLTMINKLDIMGLPTEMWKFAKIC